MTTKTKPTKRQRIFIELMANPQIKTQTEAYLKAFPNVSYQTAMVNSSRLLRNAKITDSIEQRKAEIAKYSKITPEFVVGGVVKLALESEQEFIQLGAYKTLGTYLGLEKAPRTAIQSLTDLELAQELFKRLTDRDWSIEEAKLGVGERFPEIDLKLLTESGIN